MLRKHEKKELSLEIKRKSEVIGLHFIEKYGIRPIINTENGDSYVRLDDIRAAKGVLRKNPNEIIPVCDILSFLWCIDNGFDTKSTITFN